MKAVAASSIGQYEKSVQALTYYYRAVELGLCECLRENGTTPLLTEPKKQTGASAIGAVVFGSDQGLVGQFNDVVADKGSWLTGRQVLISPQWIERVSWNEAKVFVNLNRAAIKQSPEYTEGLC